MIPDDKSYEDIYFARQPIFDSRLNVWAYELLYRERVEDRHAVFTDKLQATMRVISALPLCLDLEEENQSVIINFPQKAVIDQMQTAYPAEKTIVQLTDTDYSDQSLIEGIKTLKQTGYLFSFDNFENHPENEPICLHADFITIDMLENDRKKIEYLVNECKTRYPGCRLIAKRIEEFDDYSFAKNLGFHSYQGFFFKKPQMHRARKIPDSSLSRMKVLSLLQDENVEFHEISKAVASDVSIVHRLISYLNSPAFGLRKHIDSIEEALVIFGLNPLKKWLQIMVFLDIKPPQKPHELVLLSAHRAEFFELLADSHNMGEKKDQLFLLGLFSLIDVILEYPKDEILRHLSLSKELDRALLGERSVYAGWLDLVENCEAGKWDVVETKAKTLKLEISQITPAYEKAYQASRRLF